MKNLLNCIYSLKLPDSCGVYLIFKNYLMQPDLVRKTYKLHRVAKQTLSTMINVLDC